MLVTDAERRELRRRRGFGQSDLDLLDAGLREAEAVVSMAQLAALAEPSPAFVGMLAPFGLDRTVDEGEPGDER